MDSHLRMQSSEGRSSRVSAAEPQEGEGRSNGTRVNSVLSTRTAGMISDSNQASTSGDIPPRLGNRTKFSVAGLSDNDEIPFQCKNIYQDINSETDIDLSDYIQLPDVNSYSDLKSHYSFLSIQAQFLSDINKLKALTKCFLFEKFDEKIATFYDNIQTEYAGYNQDMFKLYEETRFHLRCLLVKLEVCKDDDPSDSNRKDYAASILYKCLEGIDHCSVGVYTRFRNNFLDLEAFKQGLESKLLEIRKGLFEQCITSFMAENQRSGASCIDHDMEIHWFNTLHNIFCKSLNIPSFDDVYANKNLEKKLIEEFKILKNLILSPSAILTKLSDVWSDNISSVLKDNGASSWETDVMNDSEFTAEIIEILDNKIFQPINCYMGRITSDPLSFSLLLDHKGNDNYSFSRYKEKLSIWLARYLNVQSLTSSPHSRVRLWGWLKNKMGVSRNNPSSEPVVTVFAAIPSIRNQCLCIGTMNRLIFWVFKPEKKLKEGQKCTFNTDNHITLQLPHLSSINFSKKSDEVTYAIMTQALAQTNTPEDIASFFLHPSMDNLAKKTKWIIKKLSTQLANKLTYNGNDFRTSLCECICSKVLASNASDVSKETLGWLIDTPLLEPVLLHINAGRMDTTPIAQSLNSWEIHSFSEDGIKRLLAVEKCCHLFQQACGLDQQEIALRLLWTGNCDLVAHCTNPKGECPLIFFASNGVSSGVKYLLERCSADVNVEDELGNTPLIYAISKASGKTQTWEGQRETLKLLLNTTGILLNKKNKSGFAAIHSAIKNDIPLECLKVLLDEKDLDVDLTDVLSNTPLHLAAYQDNRENVHALLEVNRIKADEKNNDGDTPLYISVISQANEEITKALVATNSVDVNRVFRYGNTVLHIAIYFMQIEIVHALLEIKHIKTNEKNDDGYTPLYIAMAGEGKEEITKALMATNSVDVNMVFYDGNTPLHLAIVNNNKVYFNDLLKRDDIDINQQNAKDLTPMHIAVLMNDTDSAMKLLERDDIDLSKKDNDGYTPLMLASKIREKELINRKNQCS